jgi:hypothetical protein
MIARLQHPDHGGGQPVDRREKHRGGVQPVTVTVTVAAVRGGDRSIRGPGDVGREVVQRRVGCWWLLM